MDAAMKGDNSYKSSLNKVFTKVYGDKGVKFANLYAQLTQTSGAFINSPFYANMAKGQLLSAYENGQDSYDVKIAWTAVASSFLSGQVDSAFGISGSSSLLLPASRWIARPTFDALRKLGLNQQFARAMQKGLANARFGDNGIILLSQAEQITHKGNLYIVKLKVAKAPNHVRVYGRIDEKGSLIFDYLKTGK